MELLSLSDDDLRIIRECLVAAVEGPFFPEWEFSTLVGMTRPEVAAVLAAWPAVAGNDEAVMMAVNNTLVNLIGYPHGEDLSRYLSSSQEQLRDVLHRWHHTGHPPR